MKIILSPRAEKYLKKLPKIDQIAIAQKIRSLKDKAGLIKEDKLHGFQDVYRVRIGYYRIIYRRFKEKTYIVLIGHRKDIYQTLKHLLG